MVKAPEKKLALVKKETYIGFVAHQGEDEVTYAFWSDGNVTNVVLTREDANNTWKRLKQEGYSEAKYPTFLKAMRKKSRELNS